MSERLRAVSLASRSPRRLSLLESLGLHVTIVAGQYDERIEDQTLPTAQIALHHARAKAACASSPGPPVVVAADTIVEIQGTRLGKPRNPHQAVSMLRTLAGREHFVHTGFCVVDRARDRAREGVESTRVRFMPLTEDEIQTYVATGEPMDKAGAYGIQGLGSLLVASIEGDYFTVVGLPLARVGVALKELGYRVLAA